ncbi:MAG: hypothetical protein LC667_18140, partial [Thioalkalivibrio sp.]|nr:hypothetical protein [Thioalkalivibrio sp.]
KARHLIGEGMFTDLVELHKNEVITFSNSVDGLYDEITARFRSWYRDWYRSEPLTRVVRGRNVQAGYYLAVRIDQAVKAWQRESGVELDAKARQAHREAAGDYIADALLKEHSKQELLPMVRSMFLWAHRQDETNAKGERIRFPERFLFWGSMFPLLIEALGGDIPGSSFEGLEYPEMPPLGDLDFDPTEEWDEEEDFDYGSYEES